MGNNRSSLWFLIILIYFLVHALIRTAIADKMTVDEIDIFARADTLAWSYDGAMPLYAWLQAGANYAFGETVLSLALLKNAILFLTAISIFKLVERVSDANWGFTAALSLLFIPQIFWVSQHSLTDPVLATLFAIVTFYVVDKMRENRGWLNYTKLGLVVGLGALSSVSYLWVPLSIFAAALSDGNYRPILRGPKILLTAGIAVAMSAMTYANILEWGYVADQTVIWSSSFNTQMILQRALNVYTIVQLVTAFSGLLIIGAAVAIYKGLGVVLATPDATLALRDMLVRSLSFGLIFIAAFVFLTGAQNIQSQHLQPIMVLAAPLAALFIYPLLDTSVHRAAVNITSVIAILVLLLTPAHYSFGKRVFAAETSIASIFHFGR